ncbi:MULTISPECIES: VOC family protein [unclassified Meiothermus]|uniref:VOC family protein n=1 Tax=unclassified Meiothermus TaxID=370471 RepID=UPI000D7C83A0|nr:MULTISPECIES: VOC family protein [unclassified Meiothermus]PZA08707.1 VOC family protein [Meiothermus sp. Pnk-1]RYM40673.1 VOC family protein [Meiothermus sp. PNK-Is4]
MITDIGHIAFAAHDLDRTLDFYALLGIRESFRLYREDGSLMLVYLHVGGDRFLEVFPGGPAPDPSRNSSFMHLCLVTDDLHRTVEELKAKGISIERGPSLGLDHNWQAWIKDPDGNDIELMQLAEHSPQRKVARGEPLGGRAQETSGNR